MINIALIDLIGELKQALDKYGAHTQECKYYFNPHSPDAFEPCTCGWSEFVDKYWI